MKSNFLFIRIFSVLTVAILLAGSSFGQGKGHGGGGGKGGGGNPDGGPPGQQRGSGGNPGGGQEHRGGGNLGGGQERRGGGNQWGGGGEQRQQTQQVERQQRDFGREQQMQAQRQQAQQWQQVQRQQRDLGRQQQMQAQRQQAQQWQQVQRQQRDAGRQRQMEQRQGQNIQRQQQQAYSQPQQRQENWGQIRRQQAFDAKRERDVLKYQERADRDAWKYERKQQQFDDRAYRRSGRQYEQTAPYLYEQRDSWQNNSLYQPRYRDYQSYDPGYGGYQTYGSTYPQYYQPDNRIYDYAQGYYPYPGDASYDNGYYGNNQRSSWVEPLIRSVIATFFSNGNGGGYYDDYAYGNSYGDPYYGNNYGYEPQYSSYQPTYYTFGYAPSYTYYEPASYYGYDQFAYDTIPYDAFQGALPYNDVVSIYSGGLAGELIQRALGTGYYQGLLEGQLARRRGWGDRYYSDPYLYEQAIYDPYSSSLGDSRRYFSEGYEMGYDDALRGQDEYDLADGGNVDLVSLLLGNVLSMRG